MTKNVMIGEREVGLTANGSTPFLYNQIFVGEDFLEKFCGDNAPVKDIPKATFIMAVQAKEGDDAVLRKTVSDFVKWAAGFRPLDLEIAAAECLSVFSESMRTSSNPKPAAG